MASFMAPLPRFFFCYVEPLLIAYGGLVYIVDPGAYASALVSSRSGAAASPKEQAEAAAGFSPAEQLASVNLGTMTLLVAVLAAVVMWTAESPRTVRLALLALALFDLPHWGAAAWVLWSGAGAGQLGSSGSGGSSGSVAVFRDPGTWSTELTQNMLGPVFTCSFKIAYLMGWLGRDRVSVEREQLPAGGKKKRA